MIRDERPVSLSLVAKFPAQRGNCSTFSCDETIFKGLEHVDIVVDLEHVDVLVLVQERHGLFVPVAVRITAQYPRMKRISTSEKLSVTSSVLFVEHDWTALQPSRDVSTPSRHKPQRDPKLGRQGDQPIDKLKVNVIGMVYVGNRFAIGTDT